VATYLDAILAAHRAADAADDRPLDLLLDEAAAVATRPRSFIGALASTDALAVIAEVKRRSPSKGDLAPHLDPALLAKEYERGGATCLSVLTDEAFFGGSPGDLRAARAACTIPVLRKDFVVSPRDVAEARIMGADAVLLIAAALTRDELADLQGLATSLDLDVLVEVHDEGELAVALDVGAALVGVNQRDLVTFAVDHERAVRMAGAIPNDVVKVAESGVRGHADAAALHDAGYDAILVGEALVTSSDPAAAITSLLEGP
jgi:indole-3-glycerol phosphate synthase